MDKGEEMPQWALDKAMGELAGPGVHVHSTSYAMVVDRFAVALSQARSQAYEECAKLIEDDMYTDQDIEDEPTEFRVYNRALKRQAARIRSQAIRQHSQKGGENGK